MKNQKLSGMREGNLEKEKGIVFSLEMLLIIGLIGGVFALILGNLNTGNSRVKAQNATSTLMDMTKETQNLFKSQGDFNNITPAVLLNNGVVPSDMESGVQILSQWNSVVGITPNTEVSANDSYISTYPGVSSDECSEFVNKSEKSFYKIRVAGTSVKDLTLASELSVATLGTSCASGTTVTIEFFAGRY